MQQQPFPALLSPRSRSGRRILLLALAAVLGCADKDVAGPHLTAEPPPEDELRLANVRLTDGAGTVHTRNHFIYDAAGRLEQVDFYLRDAQGGGSPMRRSRYVTHTYTGDLLAETNYYYLAETGNYVNHGRINYAYDNRGFLVRQTERFAHDPVHPGPGTVAIVTIRFRYDDEGRLAERINEDAGDRILYSYDNDGLLAVAEHRYADAPTQRRTFSYAGGRNPFYRRLAHANSLLVPISLETTLLAPANLARLENRVDPDPTLVASLTHEYETDGEGRPLRIRERFINDIDPESRGEVLHLEFDYEPAGD